MTILFHIYLFLSFDRLSSLSSPSENTLLSISDVAHAIRTLPERRLLDGYRLVSKIESTRDKLLLGFHQVGVGGCVCGCGCVCAFICILKWYISLTFSNSSLVRLLPSKLSLKWWNLQRTQMAVGRSLA